MAKKKTDYQACMSKELKKANLKGKSKEVRQKAFKKAASECSK